MQDLVKTLQDIEDILQKSGYPFQGLALDHYKKSRDSAVKLTNSTKSMDASHPAFATTHAMAAKAHSDAAKLTQVPGLKQKHVQLAQHHLGMATG